MRTRSLLQPRVGAVLALVDPAQGGQVESIHDFRVAARSLRAAVRLLTRRPGASAVSKSRRALRKAIRALADVRDRDVGHALISESGTRTKAEAELRSRLLELAVADRGAALARSLAEWPRGLDRRLIALLTGRQPSLDVLMRRIRAEAWRQRRDALDLVQSLGRRFAPDRLHELRIRIRRLRYALELLAELDLGAEPRLLLLKPLQSALGDAQDRMVLSRWLARKSVSHRRNDPGLATQLRKAAGRSRAEAVKAHARFLRLRPGEVLERLALHVDPFDSPGAAHAKPRRLRRKPGSPGGRRARPGPTVPGGSGS